MEGSYTAKAGFQWLQQMRGGNNHTNGWSKIWKLKCPEKIKFLLWTEWHESNPTLQLLHHRGVTSSNICMRCSLCEETFVYVVRDCPVSRDLSKALGFRDHTFFCRRQLTYLALYRNRFILAIPLPCRGLGGLAGSRPPLSSSDRHLFASIG